MIILWLFIFLLIVFVEKNEILSLSERSRVAAARNVVYGGSDEKGMREKKEIKPQGILQIVVGLYLA